MFVPPKYDGMQRQENCFREASKILKIWSLQLQHFFTFFVFWKLHLGKRSPWVISWYFLHSLFMLAPGFLMEYRQKNLYLIYIFFQRLPVVKSSNYPGLKNWNKMISHQSRRKILGLIRLLKRTTNEKNPGWRLSSFILVTWIRLE